MAFFASLPHFMLLSRKILATFISLVVKKTFIRNQLVFKESQPASKVYIVFKGEFELRKPLPRKVPKN